MSAQYNVFMLSKNTNSQNEYQIVNIIQKRKEKKPFNNPVDDNGHVTNYQTCMQTKKNPKTKIPMNVQVYAPSYRVIVQTNIFINTYLSQDTYSIPQLKHQDKNYDNVKILLTVLFCAGGFKIQQPYFSRALLSARRLCFHLYQWHGLLLTSLKTSKQTMQVNIHKKKPISRIKFHKLNNYLWYIKFFQQDSGLLSLRVGPQQDKYGTFYLPPKHFPTESSSKMF
eukprot:TRINITY_DN17820_c0_g1_i1.p1 TRINITY_DN17820_c0_g1~~TRINITY_DN17820_c0_g1_i1.p1  ORF type:complete len:225 (+),score=-3.78 TRINITY_DN17820_c0_g1_i1:60-734(+)